MTQLTCLIYHVLYETQEELNALSVEQKPYAVSTLRFNQQLEKIKRFQIDLLDPKQLLKPGLALKGNAVLLTFDGGHSSISQYALPLLKQHQAKALFFVSTDKVDAHHDGFSWQNLSELIKAGMSVGSHGKTNRYLPELNQFESNIEMRESKARLDQKLKQNTRFISYPGGRYSKRDTELAKALGYTCIMTSDVGVLNSPIQYHQMNNIPRISVKRSTGERSFQNMVYANPLYLSKKKATQWTKKTIRGLIGEKLYQQLFYQLFHKPFHKLFRR